MKELQQRYETKLETAKAESIVAILDAKVKATSAESTVDYVGFALENIDFQIARLKDHKKELDELLKLCESQKEIIKIGTAEWLKSHGIETLKGDIVSSMKINRPTPRQEVKILNEEALINQGYFKTSVDKTAVKNAILNGEQIDGAQIEVTHLEDSLTIYKKRG